MNHFLFICSAYIVFTVAQYSATGTIFDHAAAYMSACGLLPNIYETPYHVALNTYNNP